MSRESITIILTNCNRCHHFINDHNKKYGDEYKYGCEHLEEFFDENLTTKKFWGDEPLFEIPDKCNIDKLMMKSYIEGTP